MKRIPAALGLLAASLAPALATKAPPFTLQSALALAAQQGAVRIAQLALRNDRADLKRAQLNPLETRLPLLQAEQAVALDQAKLVGALSQARSQIVTAYCGVLEAEQQQSLATLAASVAGESVKIAQIQLANGSSTQLNLQSAEQSLASSQKNLLAAQNGLALADADLVNLIGPFLKLAGLGPLPPLPDSGVLKPLLAQNSSLLQAEQQVALAKTQLAMLNPAYSSLQQIATAKSALSQARQARSDAQSSLLLQLKNLYDQVVSAHKALKVESEALSVAQAQLATDQQRYRGGLISQIQLLQSQLSEAQAAVAERQAKDAYLEAIYALQADGGQG
jgi:outer membrane protein TolC